MGNDMNVRLSGMSGYAAGLWGRIMAQVPGVRDGSYKDTPSDIIRVGNEYYVKGTEKGRSTYYADLEKKEKEEKERKEEEERRKREAEKAAKEAKKSAKKAKSAANNDAKKAAAKRSTAKKSAQKKSSSKSKKKK